MTAWPIVDRRSVGDEFRARCPVCKWQGAWTRQNTVARADASAHTCEDN